MATRLRHTLALLSLVLFSALNSFAIDFDQDGLDDFVLIDINASGKLEWYAIDINDAARRALGEFGKVGDHLAVGNWTGGSKSSRAIISKRSNGDFEWNVDGQRTILFGSHPDMVISGLDADSNGAIDPTVVSVKNRSLNWLVMLNPSLTSPPSVQEFQFGGKNDFPFYTNVDGNGDKIAAAKVGKNSALIIRYKNLANGKAKVSSVKNLGGKIYKILPVEQANGKDVLFVVSKKGKKFRITIVKGKKKVRVLTVKADEFVVGKYLGGTSDVLVARSVTGKSLMIGATGRRSSLIINLNGILVDDVNINSFEGSSPTKPIESPPSSGPSNPHCSGTQISSDHLLYKPVSDTTGNAVIVFDSIYAREFLAVRIELKDGSFAEGWWKGLELWGNPDPGGPRQHWRTNVRSNQIKDGALIIADDTNQQCRFTLPGSANRRWE